MPKGAVPVALEGAVGEVPAGAVGEVPAAPLPAALEDTGLVEPTQEATTLAMAVQTPVRKVTAGTMPCPLQGLGVEEWP